MAIRGSCGAHEMKAAASAVTAQPAAVIFVSSGTPLPQATTLCPSVTCPERRYAACQPFVRSFKHFSTWTSEDMHHPEPFR